MKVRFTDLKKNKFEVEAEGSTTLSTIFNQLKEKYPELNKEYQKVKYIYIGKVYEPDQTLSEIGYTEEGKSMMLFLVPKKTGAPFVAPAVPEPASAPTPAQSPAEMPGASSNPITSVVPQLPAEGAEPENQPYGGEAESVPAPPGMPGMPPGFSFSTNPSLRASLFATLASDPLFGLIKEHCPEEFEKVVNHPEVFKEIERRIGPIVLQKILSNLASMSGGQLPPGMATMMSEAMQQEAGNSVGGVQSVNLTQEDLDNVNQIVGLTSCSQQEAIEYYISTGKNVEQAINFILEDRAGAPTE